MRGKKSRPGKELKSKWDEKPVSDAAHLRRDHDALKRRGLGADQRSSQGKENFYLPATKFNQILGKYKGGCLGYCMPASLGAALAPKGSCKFCINIQPDGDLLFTEALSGPRCITRFRC